MSIKLAYEEAVIKGVIENDPLQTDVIHYLDDIASELNSFKNRWFNRFLVKGLYLYGPVGAGKTFLMDLFYQHAAVKKKLRFHFHHFMQQVDAQLRVLQGQKDPLKKIASDLAKKATLLCLDEFLVYDIADAMILVQLLEELYNHKVVLVATSNTAPDNLYSKGLQRARFLPAIELIKRHCEVIALNDQRDYRLGRTKALKAYLFPLDSAVEQALIEQFEALEPNTTISQSELVVQKRKIQCIKLGKQSVWFDFNVICNLPRSQLDYLEIADRFRTVFVSNIPIFSPADTIKAILFMHFIDVMYDKGIRVIISAEVPADEIYTKGTLYNEFQRTVSRLQEMQSVDYLK